jgi:tRNA(Ile)-lysidine synthetase-like protein
MSYADIAACLTAEIGRFFRDEEIEPQTGILCAVSGGIDSTALFVLLSEYRRKEYPAGFPLAAHYVDHRLRSAAEITEEWRRLSKTAEYLEIPLSRSNLAVGEIEELQRSRREGVEAAARHARYRELEARLEETGYGYLALGHTLDDLSETMLTRFLQGCGVSGLHGIPPRRNAIIRPLLGVPKSALREYLSLRNIEASEDSSNQSGVYQRNRVRSRLMPDVEKEFPAFRQGMKESARIFRQEEAILNEQALRRIRWKRTDLQAETAAENFFKVPEALRIRSLLILINQYLPGRHRVPRSFLTQLPGTLPLRRESILLAGHGFILRRQGALLKFQASVVFQGKTRYVRKMLIDTGGRVGELRFTWRDSSGPAPGEGELPLTEEFLRGLILLRSRRSGDFIETSSGRKRLKMIFSEEKIPEHLRDSVPIVQVGERVAGVLASVYGYKDILSRDFRRCGSAARILRVERVE